MRGLSLLFILIVSNSLCFSWKRASLAGAMAVRRFCSKAPNYGRMANKFGQRVFPSKKMALASGIGLSLDFYDSYIEVCFKNGELPALPLKIVKERLLQRHIKDINVQVVEEILSKEDSLESLELFIEELKKKILSSDIRDIRAELLNIVLGVKEELDSTHHNILILNKHDFSCYFAVEEKFEDVLMKRVLDSDIETLDLKLVGILLPYCSQRRKTSDFFITKVLNSNSSIFDVNKNKNYRFLSMLIRYSTLEYRPRFIDSLMNNLLNPDLVLDLKDIEVQEFIQELIQNLTHDGLLSLVAKLGIIDKNSVSGSHFSNFSFEVVDTLFKGLSITEQAKILETTESQKGRVVLYHGDNAKQQLARDFFKELYKQTNDVTLPDNFMFLRFGNVKEKFKQQNIDLDQKIEEIKGNPEQRPQMFYATLSLFASAYGSSPLDYFSKNYDQTSEFREVPTIASICKDNGIGNCFEQIKELEKLFDAAHKSGVLVVHSVEKKDLNKAFYSCRPGGSEHKRSLCGQISSETSKVMHAILKGCGEVLYEEHCGIIPVLERPDLATCYVLADRDEAAYAEYQKELKKVVSEILEK